MGETIQPITDGCDFRFISVSSKETLMSITKVYKSQDFPQGISVTILPDPFPQITPHSAEFTILQTISNYEPVSNPPLPYFLNHPLQENAIFKILQKIHRIMVKFKSDYRINAVKKMEYMKVIVECGHTKFIYLMIVIWITNLIL